MQMTIIEAVAATGGKITGTATGNICGVSTDSRCVKADELFVALRGDRFDGHDFIGEVAAKGVRTILAEEGCVSRDSAAAVVSLITVPDTLRALGDLAAAWRSRFAIPVIGVTGSNGKTTTKEMLSKILAIRGAGLKTAGNLNNLIGLPQMIFRLTDSCHWAIFEMGMSEFGEIDRLAEIAAPAVGVITNAYPAHLASLGSVAGVARAKGELFLRLEPGGTAVYNADDPLIVKAAVPAGVKKIGFGLHGADVSASRIRSLGREGQSFMLQAGWGEREILLQAFGQHNIYNALAAAAAAIATGATLDQVAEGLAEFTPYDKRFCLEDLGVVTLVDDSYNANPASVGAALLTAREIKGESRCIAVLGDMLELGDESESAHRDAGRLAATCVEKLYLYGDMASVAAEGALEAGMQDSEVIVADSHDSIIAAIIKDHTDGDMILIKGSRGMKMDLVAAALRDNFSGVAYRQGGKA